LINLKPPPLPPPNIVIEHITHHPGETFLDRGRKLVSFEEKPIIGIGVKDIQ